MLRTITILFWNICNLRQRPQDVPHSSVLLVSLLFCNGLLTWYQLILTGRNSFDKALIVSVSLIVVTSLFTYLILAIRNLQTRFVQTLTALMGINVLIAVCILPLIFLQLLIFPTSQPTYSILILSFILLAVLIAINIWLVAVTAHIYRHALQVTFGIALLVTFSLIGIEILILKMIFS